MTLPCTTEPKIKKLLLRRQHDQGNSMNSGDHAGDYEEGLRDGRIAALEAAVVAHTVKSDNHERRLVYIERIIYGMAGILFLSAIWPKLEVMLGNIPQ